MGFPRHRVDRRRLIGLAVLGNVLPIAVASATDFSRHRPVFFAGAIAASLVPILVTALPPDCGLVRRLLGFSGLIPLTAMQAYSGGAASSYAVLIMMVMVWFGMQAEDRDVLAILGLLAACSYLPMLIFGAPAYPVHWGNATLLVLIGAAVAGALRMMTRETVRLTRRLQREAVLDPLTGLLNRRGWEQSAQPLLERARRAGDPVALVAFDLDDFKQLNDAHGHEEGDRALREMAGRMRMTMRAGDIVARIGGDEFLALLSQTDGDAASAAVARLRAADTAQLAFSAGIAMWSAPESLDELTRRADRALYIAKASGGGETELAAVALDESRQSELVSAR